MPSATIGGFGRWAGNGDGCNPEDDVFVPCNVVTLTLSRPARVLLMAQIRALREPGAASAFGQCQLASTAGTLVDTTTSIPLNDTFSEHVALVGIIGPLPAGQHAFGINCNDITGSINHNIQYGDAGISAVGISPS